MAQLNEAMITVIHSEGRVPTIPILRAEQSAKLADMYLPVRLRNFYLSLHPLIQTYLYQSAGCPEEFFILVDQEEARFTKMNMRYNRRRNSWEPIRVEEVEITTLFSEFKQLPNLEGN